MDSSLLRPAGPLLLALLACCKPPPPPAADLAPAPVRDLARPADLAALPDLSMPDLAMPDLAMPDLSMPDLAPAVLNPLPECPPAEVTATQLFNQVMVPRCGGGSCHVAGFAGGLGMGSTPQTMRSSLLTTSIQARPMWRVQPSEPDRSYLLYKLLRQSPKVGFPPGDKMPPSFAPLLSDEEFCLNYNWVRNGAPAD